MRKTPLTILALTAGLALGWTLAGTVIWGQASKSPPPISVEATEPVTYRDVVKKVLPAVVSLEVHTKPVTVRRPAPRGEPFQDPRIPEEFRRFFDRFGQDLPGFSVPDLGEMPARHGFGSGFFIDPKGVILTNNHVVAGADEVRVTLEDGRKFAARDIRTDPRTDLAVVILEEEGPFPYLEMGDSDAMHIGDRVLAVGSPFGLAGTVTHGIVSAKGRNGLNMTMYEDFIQTDAPINPGNSGGPLVNMAGHVIGINTAIKSRTGGFQGVGLAVASNLAKRVTRALRTEGVVRRGYLGVEIRDLDPAVATRLGLKKDEGVLVSRVLEGTPAAKAGLRDGDIVVQVGDTAVSDGKELQTRVAGLPIGKASGFEVLRDGERITLQVVVEEQPREFGVATLPAERRPAPVEPKSLTVDKFGVEVADLDDTMAEELGYRAGDRGVVVRRVRSGSLAETAGLRKGLLLLKVDRTAVADAAAARKALEDASPERGVLLQVRSPQGGVAFLLLKAGPSRG